MARVYLSLGSNIDRERHIIAALDALEAEFGELLLSSVYESESVGFDGSNFFNMVAGIETDLPVGKLSERLRCIEHDNGRRRDGPKFSPRTLDIDILTYSQLSGNVDGVSLPRGEIYKNAFVLQPLAELAPGDRHPLCGKSFGELWQEYDKQKQKLWPVKFRWGERVISRGIGTS